MGLIRAWAGSRCVRFQYLYLKYVLPADQYPHRNSNASMSGRSTRFSLHLRKILSYAHPKILKPLEAVISPCVSNQTGESATTLSVAHHHPPQSLPNAAPSQLAAPHLNSTAQLYSKIQSLKQQRKQTNVPSSGGCKTHHSQSQPSASTEDSRSVTDLDGLHMGQKPLKVSIIMLFIGVPPTLVSVSAQYQPLVWYWVSAIGICGTDNLIALWHESD